MDAFLPGVSGWEAIYNNPHTWHFRFNGEYPEALVKGRSAFTLNISGMFSPQTGRVRFPRQIAKLIPKLFETGPDARGMGLFRFLAATRQRFCETFPEEIDNAGVVDRRTKIVRQ